MLSAAPSLHTAASPADIQLAPAESTAGDNSNAVAKLQLQLKSVKHADLQQLTLKVSLLSTALWHEKTSEYLGCWHQQLLHVRQQHITRAQES